MSTSAIRLLGPLCLVLGASLVATGAGAASTCDTVAGGTNNPAFAEPGTCPPKPVAPTAAKPTGTPGWTRTPDGRSVWSDGTSSVSVGGYVRYDQTVGRQPQR